MSYNIPIPVNESRWQYQTASGGGLTVVMVAGSGGSIILRSPQGEDVSYRYGGVGVGAGFGARLPRFGKVNIQIKGKSVGGAAAAEAFPSTGKVFVSDALVERDLTSDDITGPCMYTEVGAGLVVGGSATALLFGLDPKLLALSVALSASPATMMAASIVNRQLVQSAKGALVMAGMNAGVQAGGGAAVYIGYLF
ncbi:MULTISPECIES: hypothetical protein [Pseudomonas]|jgi:hypothetical protein|uniref:Uncharacterized protein n=2 Tax=Pseudomonas mediterranea TaxID=183795 RepID=A0AAX2D8X4_9PSED|nr:MULTISPECIES: hypothetical protein [Pseudomonas]KGU85396.1 hypothetical protein N005_12170 [Pseudomonas mediterranea CFBP 5447]MBL0844751.1 hypothetical protein [Pseudomonas mediterranea]MDU9030604.1 hypothetical protein [Pseudomonas mediterranea]TWC16873.1 hypothetical protein FBY00_11027 [Pseudomonas sp. SJZ075]TWC25908.1 hypothetical protein FBX99_101452 [Pseudomonas sp. SJZ074]